MKEEEVLCSRHDRSNLHIKPNKGYVQCAKGCLYANQPNSPVLYDLVTVALSDNSGQNGKITAQPQHFKKLCTYFPTQTLFAVCGRGLV